MGEINLKKILIIDDDASLCEVLGMALKHAGFGVQGSTTVDEAKAKIGSFRPDLIVLDLLLPGSEGGGSGILCFLQENGFEQTPVIVITGHYTRDPDFERTIRRNPNVVDFMKKPFNPVSLAVKIRSHLSGSPRQPSAAERSHDRE